MGKHHLHSRACAPPASHTYLTIGQDLFSIEGYVRDQYNYSLHHYKRHHQSIHSITKPTDFLPAAFMVYSDIQSLRGLNEPTDYGSGIEYADGLLIDKQLGLQVGLWLNGTEGCRDIVNGVLNANIAKLFRYLVKCQAQKVFLRVGYEFDNPSFGYSNNPVLYRHAFQKMVNHCRNMSGCRDKVVFVWHSWAAGLPVNTTLQDFYPGDNFVDWVGISLFNQFYPNSSLGNIDTVTAVLLFAENQDKPVMIAESTPFGGIDTLKDPWIDWFEPALTLIEEHDIGMWSYIDCDWTTQPMWQDAGFGDTRLSINVTVLQLWQHNILHNPRFLQKGSLCSRNHHFVRRSSLRDADLTFTGRSRQMNHSVLWIVALLAALTALWFRLSHSVRRNDGCTVLQDEHEFQIERNRTGYGSVEQSNDKISY